MRETGQEEEMPAGNLRHKRHKQFRSQREQTKIAHLHISGRWANYGHENEMYNEGESLKTMKCL